MYKPYLLLVSDQLNQFKVRAVYVQARDQPDTAALPLSI